MSCQIKRQLLKPVLNLTPLQSLISFTLALDYIQCLESKLLWLKSVAKNLLDKRQRNFLLSPSVVVDNLIILKNHVQINFRKCKLDSRDVRQLG